MCCFTVWSHQISSKDYESRFPLTLIRVCFSVLRHTSPYRYSSRNSSWLTKIPWLSILKAYCCVISLYATDSMFLNVTSGYFSRFRISLKIVPHIWCKATSVEVKLQEHWGGGCQPTGNLCCFAHDPAAQLLTSIASSPLSVQLQRKSVAEEQEEGKSVCAVTPVVLQ